MNIFDSIWAFLSVVIIAWITQRITSYFERRNKIDETKLAIYMSWLPFFADVYASTRFPDSPSIEPREFLKKKMEILGIMQLMGPDGAMDTFVEFCDDAEKALKKDPSFDPKAFHYKFGELNMQLCCEIHNERSK